MCGVKRTTQTFHATRAYVRKKSLCFEEPRSLCRCQLQSAVCVHHDSMCKCEVDVLFLHALDPKKAVVMCCHYTHNRKAIVLYSCSVRFTLRRLSEFKHSSSVPKNASQHPGLRDDWNSSTAVLRLETLCRCHPHFQSLAPSRFAARGSSPAAGTMTVGE